LKKILIVGASGFIGNRLFKKLIDNPNYELKGTSLNSQNDIFETLDINNFEQTNNLLNKFKPEIIIWCAGNKNLSETEKSFKDTINVNSESIKGIEDYLNKFSSTHFIFLSSDYIFDGVKGDFKVNDKPYPKTFYGKSKLMAEVYIKKNFPLYSIVRTSAVIGEGSVFFDWLNNCVVNKLKTSLYTNYFTPTPLGFLIRQIKCLFKKKTSGTYHVCGNKILSRYDIGLIISKYYGINPIFLKKEIEGNNNFQKDLSLVPFLVTEENLNLEEEIYKELDKYENN
jgi:dTDP-4-dehydrorhamnose reductase